MKRYIGMDVHAASCTLAVISPGSGQIAREFGRLATLLLGWEYRSAA